MLIFFVLSGVSHSAFTDMKTIKQETPVKTSTVKYNRDEEGGAFDEFFDAFSSNSSSSFSM